MSKTDKTRPVWVKLLDPTMSRFVWEDHNHENGECDLDTFSERAADQRSWWPRGGNCYLGPMYGHGQKFWGRCCKRCSGGIALKKNERRRRGELHKTKREALKTPLEEMDTVDFFYSTKTHY